MVKIRFKFMGVDGISGSDTDSRYAAKWSQFGGQPDINLECAATKFTMNTIGKDFFSKFHLSMIAGVMNGFNTD